MSGTVGVCLQRFDTLYSLGLTEPEVMHVVYIIREKCLLCAWMCTWSLFVKSGSLRYKASKPGRAAAWIR